MFGALFIVFFAIFEISYVQTHDQNAWIGGCNGWL